MAVRKVIAGVLGLALAHWAVPAGAAVIQFIEPPDGIPLDAPPFVSATTSGFIRAPQFSDVDKEVAAALFGGAQFATTSPDSSQFVRFEADLIECSGCAELSDTVTISFDSVSNGVAAVSDIEFESDRAAETGLPFPIRGGQVVETGGLHDITPYLRSVNVPGIPFPSGLTIFVQSDVPEPASLSLLAAGLIGLGLAGRRRRGHG